MQETPENETTLKPEWNWENTEKSGGDTIDSCQKHLGLRVIARNMGYIGEMQSGGLKMLAILPFEVIHAG